MNERVIRHIARTIKTRSANIMINYRLKSIFNNGTGLLGFITDRNQRVQTQTFRFNNQPAIDFLDKLTKQPFNRIYFYPQTDHGLRTLKVRITTPSGVTHKTYLLINKTTLEYACHFLNSRSLKEKLILTGEEDYWAFNNEDFGFVLLQLQHSVGFRIVVDYDQTKQSNCRYLYGYTDHMTGYICFRILWTTELDEFLDKHHLIQRECLRKKEAEGNL